MQTHTDKFASLKEGDVVPCAVIEKLALHDAWLTGDSVRNTEIKTEFRHSLISAWLIFKVHGRTASVGSLAIFGTMLKKRIPIMRGFPNMGLHGPKVAASPGEACSLGEAVFSLVSEERIRQRFSPRGHSENTDGIDSMSSGSMSPDRGDVCRKGYPGSPQWEGKLELGSNDDDDRDKASDSDDDDLKDYISVVSEGPLWVSTRDFLTPPDVLVMRTAGAKWNHAKLNGSFAALWFFLMSKDESEVESEPLTEWPIYDVTDSIVECLDLDDYRA